MTRALSLIIMAGLLFIAAGADKNDTADAAVKESLKKKMLLDKTSGKDMPFKSVLTIFKAHGLEVDCDWTALKKVGIKEETKRFLNLETSGKTVEEVLKLVLAKLKP